MLWYLDLLEYVDLVVGADEVKNSKPDAEILLKICRALGQEPKRSVFVGDGESDMRTGRKAKFMVIIGVEAGVDSFKQLCELTSLVVPDLRHISFG